MLGTIRFRLGTLTKICLTAQPQLKEYAPDALPTARKIAWAHLWAWPLGTPWAHRLSSARDTYAPIEGYEAGGPFQLEAGYWTDDTIMALCLAETLLEQGGYEANDYGRRLVRWVEEGYNSLTGTCFDIGNTTRTAIASFRLHGPEHSGEAGPNSAGNGSIMRLAPVSSSIRRTKLWPKKWPWPRALTHGMKRP